MQVDERILRDAFLAQVRKAKVLANQVAIFDVQGEDDPERAREFFRRLITKPTARRRLLENREKQQSVFP
eukprot:5314627-Lingulodinium_polyedra.AAC.1